MIRRLLEPLESVHHLVYNYVERRTTKVGVEKGREGQSSGEGKGRPKLWKGELKAKVVERGREGQSCEKGNGKLWQRPMYCTLENLTLKKKCQKAREKF